MRRQVLLDTGPLVALLRSNDPFYNWTKAELATIEKPLLTCEAVVAEACFLLRTIHSGIDQKRLDEMGGSQDINNVI